MWVSLRSYSSLSMMTNTLMRRESNYMIEKLRDAHSPQRLWIIKALLKERPTVTNVLIYTLQSQRDGSRIKSLNPAMITSLRRVKMCAHSDRLLMTLAINKLLLENNKSILLDRLISLWIEWQKLDNSKLRRSWWLKEELQPRLWPN